MNIVQLKPPLIQSVKLLPVINYGSSMQKKNQARCTGRKRKSYESKRGLKKKGNLYAAHFEKCGFMCSTP